MADRRCGARQRDTSLSLRARKLGAGRGTGVDRSGRAVAGPEAAGSTLMPGTDEIVFLFDVDNTLLDNDGVQDDLRRHFAGTYGERACERYWAIFEELRNELGYADYLGALAAVQHAARQGTPVILSDGDAVFQPRKVERSGLWRAFEDRVLIYIHKEQELADVERLYPASHYVLIDDKLRILDAVKKQWGRRVTTVFPRQGHYAHDPAVIAQYPPADITGSEEH